jgi:uncharacterized protein YejL (UPF0352 family)
MKHLAEFVIVLPAHILGTMLTLFVVAAIAHNLIWSLGFAKMKTSSCGL